MDFEGIEQRMDLYLIGSSLVLFQGLRGLGFKFWSLYATTIRQMIVISERVKCTCDKEELCYLDLLEFYCFLIIEIDLYMAPHLIN